MRVKRVVLSKEGSLLLGELNKVRKLKQDRSASSSTESLAETYAEIEAILDFIVNPAEELTSVDQAVEQLSDRMKKHGVSFDEKTLRRKILRRLSPVDKRRDHVPLTLLHELEFSRRKLSPGADKERRQRDRLTVRNGKEEFLEVFIMELCDHLASDGIKVDFNGKDFFPILDIEKGTHEDHLWIQAAYLFRDLDISPERLKRCTNCGAFFLDSTNNLSKKICDDKDCLNARGYDLLKRYRQKRRLHDMTKDLLNYLKQVPEPIPSGEFARRVQAGVHETYSKLDKVFGYLSGLDFDRARKHAVRDLSSRKKVLESVLTFQKQIETALKSA